MPAILHCWPLYRAVKHAVRHAIKRHHRPSRHAHRIARVVASKPAIIGYVCVAVTGGFIANLPQFTQWGNISNIPATGTTFDDFPIPPLPLLSGGTSAGDASPLAERPWAAPLSRDGHPIPEPSSLALLLPALTAVAVWMRR